jgi:anti-sigma B factor antagonist
LDLLGVDVTDQNGWRVVTATGQLDVATAPEFRQTLVQAQYGGETHVVVDLNGVEFIDSMGLGVLVGGLKRARTHQCQFVVACEHPRILRVLELTGLGHVLRVVPDTESVVR